ncbi:hypothetical protein ILUMI_17024 [Ignelater luminosus]|uniref:Uncharacterized protein n=1 Tax=Ignelater luminosus TaxID=2038154 RepID=A0A8K0CKM4_IGNLU|nr:hypothetical protein ILUMI_17024 [Ignelater luminosus]
MLFYCFVEHPITEEIVTESPTIPFDSLVPLTRSVKHCRSYKGADTNSDHVLIIAKDKQDLPIKTKLRKERQTYKIDRLQDKSVANQLEDEINKKLEKPLNNDLEEEWRTIQKTMTEATKLYIGRAEIKKKEDWIDDNWETTEKLNRWAEYFEDLLNKDEQIEPKGQKRIQRNDREQAVEPTEQEIEDIIKKQKIIKAQARAEYWWRY